MMEVLVAFWGGVRVCAPAALEMQRTATPRQKKGWGEGKSLPVLWGGGHVKSSGPREGWISC